MKKLACMFLVLISVFLLAVPAFAATPETVVPYYTNAKSVRVTLEINSSGLASVNVFARGETGTTSINVTYYLEKKVGSSWSRVDIGTVNNQWTHSVSGTLLSQTKTFQLNSAGTYRAVAIFKVTISSTETITLTDEAIYSTTSG